MKLLKSDVSIKLTDSLDSNLSQAEIVMTFVWPFVQTEQIHKMTIILHFVYRDSPISAVFGPQQTTLIGDWFSTKIAILDFWIFKVPFFCSFWLNFNNKMILLSLFWQLFESSITNSIFLTTFYATFSLDYYWNSDLTFIVHTTYSWNIKWHKCARMGLNGFHIR